MQERPCWGVSLTSICYLVVRKWAEFSYKATCTCSSLSGRFWKIIIVGLPLAYSDLNVQINWHGKDFQQLINGRRIVGIVIKICALLKTFLPILENRELLTHVIATKSICVKRYVQRANSARQFAVCKHTLKQILNLTLLIVTTSKHFVLACAIWHMPIHACAKVTTSYPGSLLLGTNTVDRDFMFRRG